MHGQSFLKNRGNGRVIDSFAANNGRSNGRFEFTMDVCK